MTKGNKLPYIGSGVITLIALAIMVAKPFGENLNDTAHLMLGGILIALAFWIFKPFNLPYFAGVLFVSCFALALGLRPTVVFSGFTQPALWTLIPALFFGFTLQKTGLGERIVLVLLKMFKPTYLSLVIA